MIGKGRFEENGVYKKIRNTDKLAVSLQKYRTNLADALRAYNEKALEHVINTIGFFLSPVLYGKCPPTLFGYYIDYSTRKNICVTVQRHFDLDWYSGSQMSVYDRAKYSVQIFFHRF